MGNDYPSSRPELTSGPDPQHSNTSNPNQQIKTPRPGTRSGTNQPGGEGNALVGMEPSELTQTPRLLVLSQALVSHRSTVSVVDKPEAKPGSNPDDRCTAVVAPSSCAFVIPQGDI